MTNTNATNFRKDMYNMIDRTIKFNEPINIATKSGNAVLISEDDYNGLIETLNLISVDGMEDKISQGIKTSLDECVGENEVEW